jgi:hypothetical protein
MIQQLCDVSKTLLANFGKISTSPRSSSRRRHEPDIWMFRLCHRDVEQEQPPLLDEQAKPFIKLFFKTHC